MHQNLLVLDVGTTSAKAVIFDSSGAIVSSATRSVETVSRADGTREQSTRQWWQAITEASRALAARDTVSAIALTGSMQNLIVVTADGALCDRAILYSDSRVEQADIDALTERLPADFVALTGNTLDPASVISRIATFSRFYPEIETSAVRSFLFGAKDALIFRMTGRAVCDPTTASTTGLMDFVGRLWSDKVVAAAGIERAQLPDILPATAVTGRLRADAAAELGLAAGLPVHAGAGDAAAATWGAFANSGGAAYCYLGTTGWVATTVDDRTALKPDVYRLAEPVFIRKTIAISSFLSAGAAFGWLAGCVAADPRALAEEADAADGQPPSLLFLPYLSGERAPFDDRSVRAAFLGIDGSHGRADLAYSVMEGIAHAVRHNLESLNPVEAPLTMIGGGAERALQRQLVADVLDRPVAFGEASATITAFGIYRMIAPLLEFAGPGPSARHLLAARSERRSRADRRYAAYLEAAAFARRHAASLAEPAGDDPAAVETEARAPA
ncbi:MAG: FGGY family carbohydrate kinase [Pararhizobium sp.]